MNNYLVTYIEKDIFKIIECEKIMRQFQNMKNRREQLSKISYVWKNKLKFTFYIWFCMTIILLYSCLYILLLILINFLLSIFLLIFSQLKFLALPLYIYIYIYIYSLRPSFFVIFEKLNFLKEHHLLSCLPFKNV